MSKKKPRNQRVEIRVDFNSDNLYSAYDRSGLIAQGYCASKRDVAREATSATALALSVPEGRIKISRINYDG